MHSNLAASFLMKYTLIIASISLLWGNLYVINIFSIRQANYCEEGAEKWIGCGEVFIGTKGELIS